MRAIQTFTWVEVNDLKQEEAILLNCINRFCHGWIACRIYEIHEYFKIFENIFHTIKPSFSVCNLIFCVYRPRCLGNIRPQDVQLICWDLNIRHEMWWQVYFFCPYTYIYLLKCNWNVKCKRWQLFKGLFLLRKW